MIHEMSEAISRKISILNNVTETEEQEVITYGLEAILATAVSVLCVVILSVLLHRVLECIAFLVAFMPLRTYSGGYHASSHMRCVLLLITVFLLEILILHIYDTPSKEVCWVFLLCSVLIVCILAPIIDINHPLSKKQAHENKMYSCNSGQHCCSISINQYRKNRFIIGICVWNICNGYIGCCGNHSE